MAVRNTWAVLTYTAYHKIAVQRLDKNDALSIFDGATATMGLLVRVIDHETLVSQIQWNMFATLMNILNTSITDSFTADDFNGRNIFEKCVAALKRPDGIFKYNEKNWKQATRFFFCCYKRNILVTNEDFAVLVPFFTAYIKKAPDEALLGQRVFYLLDKAIAVLGKQAVASSPGLIITLGNLLDSSSKNFTIERTKALAATLFKALL